MIRCYSRYLVRPKHIQRPLFLLIPPAHRELCATTGTPRAALKTVASCSDGTSGKSLACVVWGLGGAGKSQLVHNYIQQCRHDYSAIFWIEAGSKESIERDYIQIYRLLCDRRLGAGQETLKVEDAVPAIKYRFHGREGRWLVVFYSADSIDDAQDWSYIDLRHFMPDAPGVHIIITSLSSTVKEMTSLKAIQVADMESSEATEVFR